MLKKYQTIIIFLSTVCCMVSAQVITITYPKGGETFRVGDTVTIEYQADKEYKDGATGSYIGLSSNLLKGFERLRPLHLPDTSKYNTVLISDPYWGKTKIVIPDSLKLELRTTVTTVSSITDSAVFRISDYSGLSYPYAISKPVKILPRAQVESENRCGKGSVLAFLPLIGISMSRFLRKRKSLRK